MTSAKPQTSLLRLRNDGIRERLRLARDTNDVADLLDAEVRSLSFDRWIYEQLQPPIGTRKTVRLGSLPDGSQQTADPRSVFDATLKTTRPFVSLDAAGAMTGAVPIHGPAGSVANLSVSKDAADETFRDLFGHHSDALLLMALEAQERIIELTDRSDEPPNPLSDRQLEVLRWTIKGKTNWEIGRLLGITEDTVRQHMIKICRLLGATNRTQAAVIAVSTGLLVP